MFHRPLLTAALLSTLLVGSAAATQLFDTTVSSCTTENCSSTSIGGTVNGLPPTVAGPWTAEIFARAGNCLRLDVTSQTIDLETVVVSPSGTFWRADDTVGSRPIVKFLAPVSGWYTVSISHWAGSGVQGDFVLAFGHYLNSTSNTNCRSPTPAGTPARNGKVKDAAP